MSKGNRAQDVTEVITMTQSKAEAHALIQEHFDAIQEAIDTRVDFILGGGEINPILLAGLNHIQFDLSYFARLINLHMKLNKVKIEKDLRYKNIRAFVEDDSFTGGQILVVGEDC